MNEKPNISKDQVKNVIIIGLLITVVILLIILVFRGWEPKVVYQNESSTETASSKSSSNVSPYVKNAVNNTIKKKWKELNGCYNKFLATTPPPTVTDGRITVDWQVEPDGDVISPEIVSSDINNPMLEECLVSSIESWTFPPPPSNRNTYVFYKFFFKKTE